MMRTIGVIGGTSWQSSAVYYRLLNELVARRLGGSHSAKLAMISVDFADVERAIRKQDWLALESLIVASARALKAAGAEGLVIASGTMQRCADAAGAAAGLKVIHLVDLTADAIAARGLGKVGVLGTALTMTGPFYRPRLAARHGVQTLSPEPDDAVEVNRIVFEELVLGQIEESSREAYRRAMANLVARGAEGIVLGCTEQMLLVGEADASVPVFDTTTIHVAAAVDWALA